eukprot:4783385-Amphidinium_carterae.2
MNTSFGRIPGPDATISQNFSASGFYYSESLESHLRASRDDHFLKHKCLQHRSPRHYTLAQEALEVLNLELRSSCPTQSLQRVGHVRSAPRKVRT